MQMNIYRCALMVISALGLTACAANFHAPPAPEPVHPLYHCTASGQYGAPVVLGFWRSTSCNKSCIIRMSA